MLAILRPLTAMLVLLTLVGGTVGCNKDEITKADQAKIDAQKKVDESAIQAYVTANNLTATRTSSGLYYVVITPAPAGAAVAAVGKTAVVNYIGYPMSGTTRGPRFDSSYSRSEPFIVKVGTTGVIAGWTEGLQLMHKGERGWLIIPSYLAYGTAGSGSIAPNTVLIFDMKVEDVQ
jgi:FKBP-type peptidyl-prolyl cis-trans isomerase